MDGKALVITGSAANVYDPDPWIEDFRAWLGQVDPGRPMVGICFGHQAMADAYGGVVRKSPAGWAGGLREYRVRRRERWMDHEASRLVLPIAHHDHVVVAPPSTQVIADSDASPCAVLAYSGRRAISFQGHPEFPLDYTRMLLDFKESEGAISEDEARLARKTLAGHDDRKRVVGWIRRFVEGVAS